MDTTDVAVVVEVDSRRRVSLGKIGRQEHTRYIVEEEPDGTIVLTPAVVVPEVAMRLLANPDLVRRIQEQLDSDVRLPRPRREQASD